MNRDPNSERNSALNPKLGWVHSAHTQNPGREHTARAVPRSWALLRARPIGRVHVTRTTSAGRALSVHRSRHAQAIYPKPGRDIISRSRPPRQLSQVTTSIPCRDLPSAQPKPPRSRPQKWGRDTNFNKPGRDLISMW